MGMTKNGFIFGYFSLGVLYLLFSFFSYITPSFDLSLFMFLFGSMAIYKGGIELASSQKQPSAQEVRSYSRAIAGMVDVSVGAYLLCHLSLRLFSLPFVLAIWFTFDGLSLLLINNGIQRNDHTLYRVRIMLNIASIAMGSLLFFNTRATFLTLNLLISLYLVMVGVNYIFLSFFFR